MQADGKTFLNKDQASISYSDVKMQWLPKARNGVIRASNNARVYGSTMEEMKAEMIVDVRGLEPPEPLERVLEALTGLQAGRTLRMLIGREPHPLYGILEDSGFQYETQLNSLGYYEILIRRRT